MKKSLFLLMPMLMLSFPLQAENANDLIVQADQAYLLRNDDAQARAALALYEKAAQADVQSTEARWKASRACWWVADHSSSKKEKIELLERGISWGQDSVRSDPKSADGFFWLGGNQGSYGEVKGVLKSLALVKPIRAAMNTVIAIDPNYEGGAGYRVLGVVDYKVPGFAGGNKKRAFDNLSKALQIASDNPFNLYYIAEYYSTVGETAKALTYLGMLAELKPASEQQKPDLETMQKKGEALKKKL